MSRTASTTVALPPLAALPPVSRLLVATALVLARWETRRRSRIALERLAPHHLHDIGLTRTAAQIEVSKPFWRG